MVLFLLALMTFFETAVSIQVKLSIILAIQVPVLTFYISTSCGIIGMEKCSIPDKSFVIVTNDSMFLLCCLKQQLQVL
jgi:hypothetical protein